MCVRGRDETSRHRIGFTPLRNAFYDDFPAVPLEGAKYQRWLCAADGPRCARARENQCARLQCAREGRREDRGRSKRVTLQLDAARVPPGSTTRVFVPGLRHMWRHSGTAPSWPLCRPTTAATSLGGGRTSAGQNNVKPLFTIYMEWVLCD